MNEDDDDDDEYIHIEVLLKYIISVCGGQNKELLNGEQILANPRATNLGLLHIPCTN